MESGVQDQRPNGQQVMIAQVREAAPREPGRLEGETHGPNYDQDPQPEQLLPNGVSHGPAGNSPADSAW